VAAILGLVAGVLPAFATGTASALPGRAAAAPPAPTVVPSDPTDTACLPLGARRSRGRLAVDRLGADLDRVAKRIGRTGAALRTELLRDDTLWVDSCSRPYYVEPEAPAADPGAGGQSEAASGVGTSAVLPYAETFRLHSRPDALRVIHLDFDGFLVAGSSWAPGYNQGQSWTAPAYDTDGSPGTFSNAEREVVQSVWQRVAEDYAPFDVDVTTEDPGFDAIDRSSSSDTRYGTRALITKDTVVGGACGCGGIAYVGTFDTVQAARYQPAFVFTAGVGTGAKNLAEATSHEVGHNLGLSHDGTTTGCGTGGTSACGYYQGASGSAWAPIMGVGYYKPVTQWSKGEYAAANNTENDFTVIAANGVAVLPDDRSGTIATAPDLGLALPAGVTGVIETAADVDMYRFTSPGGALTVSVAPAPVSPDLDAKVTLYDAAGTVVGSADPAAAYSTGDVATGLAASYTSGALAGGTYYVGVEGVGVGVPTGTGYTDFGSIGPYSLAISTTGGPAVATSTLPDTATGVAYGANLQAAGGSTAYTWSVTAGALPAGLTLGTDGAITGTPTSATAATFTVQVSDSAARTATRSLTISPGLTITSRNLPEASTGVAYSTTLTVAGGTGPHTWALASGSLPTGLSLTSAGVISGTPTTAATTAFTVRVTDSAARTRTRVTTITVASALSASSLTDSTLAIGAVPPALNLTGSGGRPGYIWTLLSGALPAGLQLNDVGTITGTPTSGGSYAATVRATDRSGRTASASVSLTVAGFAFSPSSLAAARQGVPYSQAFSITYTGSTAPTTWSVAGGSLPAGITVSGSSLTGTPTVTGTFPVTLRATDAAGWTDTKAYSLLVNPPTVPGAPTIGTATAGNGEATVTWTAPASDGGSPVTGYVVTPYVGATAQTPRAFAGTATTQVVTGLANGTAHTFRVAATNAAGTGAPSAASNTVTPAPILPQAPTGASAVRGDTQATVSWLAPASDGGSPITGYVVTPYDGATALTSQSFASAATTQVVTGLANGTAVTFRVAATNSVGTGPQSTPSAAVTPAGAPGAPTIGTATPGNGQATVTWSAPDSDGGSPVTGYVVTPYVGATAQAPLVTGSTGTTATVTGLTNGTGYTFRVAATNDVGTGAQSAASNVATPTGIVVTSTANPSVTGQSVTLKATSTVGTTGMMSFYDGTTLLATKTVSSGVATLVTGTLAPGDHSITASYKLTSTSTPAVSNPLVQHVDRGDTTTVVTSTPVTTVFGQAAKIKAAVARVAPAVGTPTGSVSFYDAGTLIGTLNLSSGAATLTVKPSVGTHPITAVYAGSTTFVGSASSTYDHQVGQAATTSNVTSTANPSVVGQTVTIKVKVAAVAPGTGTPTGEVDYYEGGLLVATRTLASGSASLSIKPTIGAHDYTVAYRGATSYSGSAGAITQTVNAASTKVTITSSYPTTTFGHSGSITATVAAVSPGTGVPTGTVDLYDDGVFVATRTLVSGKATLPIASLAVGVHHLTATYAGDGNYAGSTTTTAFTQTIT
jgi:hypothetical protein